MPDRDRLFIGGTWEAASSDERIEVRNPANGQFVGSAPAAREADVDLAVARARRAFEEGPWPRMSMEERVAIIREVAKKLEPRLEEVLELVTQEMGIPIRMSRALHQDMALASVENACSAAETLEVEYPATEGKVRALIRHEPAGVVASIAPWNGPFVQALYKLVYPLLAGCPVVFKPAPETPLNAFVLADAIESVGLPEGVVSIIPGGRTTGEHLVRHPGVDSVFFTGSTAAGRRIGAICGGDVRRMTLELGGKSAAILLDDADVDAAIGPLTNGAFGNTGQNCAATSRVLVPEAMFDDVVDRLCASADGLRVGDPMDTSTDLGPLISRRQLDKVIGYVGGARERGANILTGGRRPEGLDDGWFYEPTVITGVENSDEICQEEVFGPVVCVLPYRDEAEALRMANDSVYGLHGAVFSADEDRALEVARTIRTGTYSINGFLLNSALPYGGYKLSGMGRKYGAVGIREFMEIKAINYATVGTFSFSDD